MRMRLPWLGLAIALTACGGALLEPFVATTDPALLQGVEWTLVAATDANASTRLVRVDFSATFADARVAGRAGPNWYGGTYEADGAGRLVLVDVWSTLIGGREAEAAGALLVKLADAHAFEVSADRLRIRTGSGAILHFAR